MCKELAPVTTNMILSIFRIGRVRISITNEDNAVDFIKGCIRVKVTGYVCISNMRTVVIANNDKLYWNVMENSLMNTPDGIPLVWCGHWWGLRDVQRACGPHIFTRILKDDDSNLRHFFLGDTGETLEALTQKAINDFGANVVGSYSPPFAPLEEYDIPDIAKMINDSGATIVWLSLRAPKQDFLSAMITPYLNEGIVLVGVGAAFRSFLGELRQPDGLLQKIGLGGLLLKRNDSSWLREIKWYLIHSMYLINYCIQIHWKKWTGRKYYDMYPE